MDVVELTLSKTEAGATPAGESTRRSGVYRFSPACYIQQSRNSPAQPKRDLNAMPIHDWTLATAGTYHDFHLKWIAAITDDLNAGKLPPELFAMAEQIIGGPAPDVVTLRDWPDAPAARHLSCGTQQPGGVATLPEPIAPPATEFSLAAGPNYVRKKSQIVVKHELGHVISVIELVSPGNKHSQVEVGRLVQKSASLIHEGINLLVIDPFPPTLRDPQGDRELDLG